MIGVLLALFDADETQSSYAEFITYVISLLLLCSYCKCCLKSRVSFDLCVAVFDKESFLQMKSISIVSCIVDF